MLRHAFQHQHRNPHPRTSVTVKSSLRSILSDTRSLSDINPDSTTLAYSSKIDSPTRDSTMRSQPPASTSPSAHNHGKMATRDRRRSHHLDSHDQQALRAMYTAETYRLLHSGPVTHNGPASPPHDADEAPSPGNQHRQRREVAVYLPAKYSPCLHARDVVEQPPPASEHTHRASYSGPSTPREPGYYGPAHYQSHRRSLPSTVRPGCMHFTFPATHAPRNRDSMAFIRPDQLRPDADLVERLKDHIFTPYESHWDRVCRVGRECAAFVRRI
jgi:hypothetical protein